MIALALITSTALADIVVLKTGEKVEGKVISETDQQVTMEVKISAGVTDERIIPKAQVERIDKVLPETEAYRAILGLQPPNTSVAAAHYDPAIATLQNYIRQFPNAGHAEDAKKTLQEFLADKKRVEAGDVKLQGIWLTKEEVEKEKVQIQGRILLEYMKAQSASRDNIGALNTFVTLEKNYGGAAVLPDAIELAQQLIAAVKPAVERAIPEQKILKANKEAGFKNGSPDDQVAMKKAYKEEMDAVEAATAAAEKAGQWPPFIVTNEKCLKALTTKLDKEAARLAGLPVDNMRKSVELSAAAKKSIDAEDIATADGSLKEASKLWPKNEMAVRLTKIVAEQKASLTKAAADAKKSATPAPATPAPKATPKPKSTPVRPAAAAATPAPEESRPFLMSLPGAITVVVGIAAVLAGVNVYKKMKARKEASPDVQA